jgi:hypothetical protein
MKLLRCSPVLQEVHFKLLLYRSSFACLNQCEEHFLVGRKEKKKFDTLKEKISIAPVLAWSNLQ